VLPCRVCTDVLAARDRPLIIRQVVVLLGILLRDEAVRPESGCGAAAAVLAQCIENGGAASLLHAPNLAQRLRRGQRGRAK
jgi:hypothetical protein